MIKLENGVLNIGGTRIILNFVSDACLLVLLCIMVCHSNNVQGHNYAYYFGFFLFVGVSLLRYSARVIQSGKMFIPLNAIWLAVFILYCYSSVLWAIYPELVSEQFSKMIQALALTFCIAVNYSGLKAVYSLMRVFVLASVYSSIYIIIKTPIEDYFSGGFGAVATDQNANGIGLYFTMFTIIAFYLAYCETQKLYYIPFFINTCIVILTSSRKSIICIVLGIIMIIMLYSHGRSVFKVLFVLLICAVVVFLLFKVDVLYKAVGYRFSSMIEFYRGNESADGSIYIRRGFIATAKRLFLSSPVLGVGFRNFSAFSTEFSRHQTYAHNNYFEILSCLGIVGFVLYYWFYAYGLIKLFDNYLRRQKISALMITIIFVLLALEYGIVHYYNCFVMMILGCVYVCACAPPEEVTDTYSFNTEYSDDAEVEEGIEA